MRTKTTIVTGASGFVGANLVRHLEQEGARVHAVVRQPESAWRLSGLTNTTIHRLSLTDLDAVTSLVTEIKADVIFHLAAASPYGSTVAAEHFRTNALSTAHLVDLAAAGGAGAIVVAGSSSEYGVHATQFSEETLCMPVTAYGVSKLAGSLYCAAVGQQTRYPAVVLRIFSAYGPYEPGHRLFPTILTGLLRNTPLHLGAPQSARDYVHVEDLVRAFEIAALRADSIAGEIINLASGDSTSVQTVVEVAMLELGRTVPVEWGTPASMRPWDRTNWVGSTDKAARLLGWSPRIPLTGGIRTMAAWLGTQLSVPEYAPADR